ncbi:MAG: IPExxxVDY family protein [Salinivirgaceae bacterium]|nr:MAG: IPExxxVDY family protein [Salinivirgaceae bacterium]
MGNVFCLEPEENFPEIYGVVASLPPWKMCYLLSKVANVELIHEDALNTAPPPIQLVTGSSMITFEKFVWLDVENEQFIHLVQNIAKSKVKTESLVSNNTLFGDVDLDEQSFTLLSEWGDVNYLIKTEGCEDFFDPYALKNEKGIRMVLKSTVDQFKNYDKIV